MKKIALLAFLLPLSMLAQKNLRLVRTNLSAGIFSTNQTFIDNNAPAYTGYNYNSPGYTDPKDIWKYIAPSVFAGLNFYAVDKIEIGLVIGYSHAYESNYTYYDSVGNPLSHEKVGLDVFSFAPTFRLSWIESEDHLFEFYSSINFGLSLVHEYHSVYTTSDSYYPMPCIQLNAFGMRFGNKFGGFVELGVGAKGLLSAGLSYRP